MRGGVSRPGGSGAFKIPFKPPAPPTTVKKEAEEVHVDNGGGGRGDSSFSMELDLDELDKVMAQYD